jgi:CRISPR-associated protein Cmr4
MQPSLFTITAQTNIHVGSGDANYGIIDKLVQRDTLADLPIINASSLKGAILQHFFRQDPNEVDDEYIDIVFGGQQSSSKRRKGLREKSKGGEFVFMQANLLSIPVRSNQYAFFRVSCPQLLRDLSAQLSSVGGYNDLVVALDNLVTESSENAVVLHSNYVGQHHLEDQKDVSFQSTLQTAPAVKDLADLLGGNNTVIIPDGLFRSLTDNHHLPVIARNNLENGQSTNLWYEQVLPRQTRFSCIILKPHTPNLIPDFDTLLTSQGMVQIGANASVGYGYCNIKPFKSTQL